MKRLALALAALAAGCLGPRADHTRFFTLTPLVASEAETDHEESADLTVGLGPVVLPGYLDRTPVVRRTGDNEIGVSATDRWAEPLGYAFASTLRQNLVVLLGTPRVVLHPWLPGARPDLAVQVDVLRFEAAGKGEVAFAAEWNVRRVADGKVLVGRLSRITEPAGGSGSDEVAAALSRALGAFSREVAAAVRDEHSAGRDRLPSRPRG
jgi:uncharacterized lipoprotein YmbA